MDAFSGLYSCGSTTPIRRIISPPHTENEMSSVDPFKLERFVTAQQPVFEAVLAELRASRKRTHWMWFIFPQLAALGRSSTAQFYGISSIREARAYLAHPVLGPRLDLCTRIVLASESPSV